MFRTLVSGAAAAFVSHDDESRGFVAALRDGEEASHPERAAFVCIEDLDAYAGLFRELDPLRWRDLDNNPVALLQEMSIDRLEERASALALHSRINHAYRRMKEQYDKGDEPERLSRPFMRLDAGQFSCLADNDVDRS